MRLEIPNETVKRLYYRYIEEAYRETGIFNLDLDRTGGKIHGPGGAAELLGINASTLRNRMKKPGIVYYVLRKC